MFNVLDAVIVVKGDSLYGRPHSHILEFSTETRTPEQTSGAKTQTVLKADRRVTYISLQSLLVHRSVFSVLYCGAYYQLAY